jgi:hypothetical protein
MEAEKEEIGVKDSSLGELWSFVASLWFTFCICFSGFRFAANSDLEKEERKPVTSFTA